MTDVFDGIPEEKVRELMGKMEPCFHGYPRMVVILACSRSIAAMFGPAEAKSREDYLARFPGYMRSMWRYMDQFVQ
jgi:hypothetical protein